MSRLLVVLFALLTVNAEENRQTYNAMVESMKCYQNSMDILEYDYQINRSLHFIIAGINEKDADITFMASSFDGNYYTTIGILHDCVIVKPGQARDNPLDVAFVSPRTGKVYRD